MELVAYDDETVTVRFTKPEFQNLKAATGYVSSLFEYLDREALDGYRMTEKEADDLAYGLAYLSTPGLTGGL
jgi:hypothetical protein